MADTQETQEQMMADALKVPGVAEAAAVYEHLAPYAGIAINVGVTQIRNATGGNA